MAQNRKVSPSRIAAFDILWRVWEEDAYASNLLASDRYDRLSREDRGLLQELSLGVLRNQSRLDFLIERYSRRKISKLDKEVVIALRLGLYQLGFLTRIPARAAINESVNLVKEKKKQSAAPMVNAALRAAQRDPDLNIGELIDDPIERLSVEHSHPAWLIKRWIDRFGEAEARELAEANNSHPRAAFRLNRRVQSAERTLEWLKEKGFKVSTSDLTPGAFLIDGGDPEAQSDAIEEGWIYLQDEASQLVGNLAVGQQSEEEFQISSSESQIRPALRRLLDLCAAPGSKTTMAASLLPAGSLIVAGDLRLHRLKTMRELSGRQRIDNINMVQLDASADLPFEEQSFDAVLLDAPCSGLGTLQKHPEIKWKITLEKISELAVLQRRLISRADRALRAGGLLIYSVCSTEPEEGEDVIAWFRENHTEYRDVTRERLIEIGAHPERLLTSRFGARTFPHRNGAEGFYFCVLWKRR